MPPELKNKRLDGEGAPPDSRVVFCVIPARYSSLLRVTCYLAPELDGGECPLSRASKVVYLFGSVYLENLVLLSLQGHHVLLKYTRHSRCYRAPSRSKGLARCLRQLLQRAELPAALLPGPETIVLDY